ncbi:hypothetical protein GCM10025856_24860 [Methylophaga marina]|uniref:Uncharacterized protein n=1 Tax=Methylophaga marina TaxID=45495 RepID=A0ABN0TKI3_9GAMM|nr:hypothetical protein [Methylophaga marina]BDZ74767.1 hypothetical protein GCM10025856_24860 [Methylophaga marina]
MCGARNKKKTVLRDERDRRGLRFLSAEIQQNGDLVFEGQDLGPAVEEFFGSSEYEWRWTIKAEHMPILQKALGVDGDIINLLETRFSNEKSAGVLSFLEEHNIPYESWHRYGD